MLLSTLYVVEGRALVTCIDFNNNIIIGIW